MDEKRLVSIVFMILIVALFAFMVFALNPSTGISNMKLNEPIARQNISGNFTVNVTAAHISYGIDGNDGNITNVSVIFWNASNLAQKVFTFVMNATAGNNSTTNTTFNATLANRYRAFLPDGIYNISINATNASDGANLENNTVFNTAADFIHIDNSPPSITAINSPANNTYLGSKQALVFNVTITNDTGFTDIHVVNISNGTGGESANIGEVGKNTDYFNSSVITRIGDYFNMTINGTGNLTEGRNTIRVAANDTAGNLNNTFASVNIYLDTQAPMVRFEVGSGVTPNWTWTDDNTPVLSYNFTDNSSSNASCELFVDNIPSGINSSVLNNSKTDVTVNASLTQGMHNWYVNCTDLGSNVGTSLNESGKYYFDYRLVNVRTPADNDWTSVTSAGNISFTFAFNATNATSSASETDVSNVSCQLWITNSSGSFRPMGINNTTVNNTATTITNNGSIFSGLTPNGVAANWTINCTWNGSQITAVNDGVYTLNIDNSTPTVALATSDVAATSATLTATTSELATCKYATESSVGYDSMTEFGTTGSVTSHTTSLVSLASSTDYTYYVKCRDRAANEVSGSKLITTSAGASGSGSGGSSGGSGVGTVGQFAKTVWTSINAGERASVSVENGAIGVTDVSFVARETTYGAWVKVEKMDSLPGNVESFAREVYRYIKITENNVERFMDGSINIDFKVEKAWLEANSVDKDSIAIFRNVGGKWVELETSVGKDDGVYIFYTADSPGFSYFIIGERAAGAEPLPVETEPITGDDILPEAVEKAPEVARESAAGVPAWVIIMVVLLLIVVATVLWLRKRK